MPKRTLDFREELLKDLADPREAAYYINAALEDSEEMFLIALRDVAEARQMSKVATGAGVSRESIYRMLSRTGNPTHSSLRGILKAMDLKLSVEAIGVSSAAASSPSPIGGTYNAPQIPFSERRKHKSGMQYKDERQVGHGSASPPRSDVYWRGPAWTGHAKPVAPNPILPLDTLIYESLVPTTPINDQITAIYGPLLEL